jgi:hypothetical protein
MSMLIQPSTRNLHIFKAKPLSFDYVYFTSVNPGVFDLFTYPAAISRRYSRASDLVLVELIVPNRLHKREVSRGSGYFRTVSV